MTQAEDQELQRLQVNIRRLADIVAEQNEKLAQLRMLLQQRDEALLAMQEELKSVRRHEATLATASALVSPDMGDASRRDARELLDGIISQLDRCISQLTNEEGAVSDYLKVIPLGTSKAKMMEIELAKSPYALVETSKSADKEGQTRTLHIWNATFDVSPLRKVTIESNNTFSYYRNAEQVFDGDMLVDTKYQRVVCNTDGEIVEVGKVMTYQEALQASGNTSNPQLSLK